MDKKTKGLCVNVFAVIAFVGLVLAVVAMCVGVVSYNVEAFGKSIASGSIGLGDEFWSDGAKANNAFASIGLGAEIPQPTFAIIAYIVTLAGCAVVIVNEVLRLVTKKDFRLLRMIGAAAAVVGAVLVLIAGLTLAGGLNGEDGKVFSAGAGIWLGFIGGLLGGVFGALPLLKAFN